MTPITLESRFIISKEALFRDLDGEAVILNLDAGTYYGLNAVGTRMWQLLERHGRLKPVFEELCREYDVAPNDLERDLIALVGRLAEVGLGRIQ